MKKMLAIVLALILSCSLLSAVAEDDFLGVWYLTALRMGEVEMDPASMGISMTLTVNEDGTGAAVTAQGGQEMTNEFTWELRDGQMIMFSNGEEGPMTIEDGILVISNPSGDMILSREAPEPVVLPEAIPAESEEAFIGSWTLSKVDMNGEVFSVDVLTAYGVEISCTLNIEAGKAALALNFMGVEVPLEGETTFADGALSIAVLDADAVTVQLLDDGGLFAMVTVPLTGAQLPLYFVPAAAEEAPAA